MGKGVTGKSLESIAALSMEKLLVVAAAVAVAAGGGVQVITLVPLTFWVLSSTNRPSTFKHSVT